MLASRLGSFEGLRVADLYAGSGALGLEALSRGSAFACFVDQEPGAIAAIRENLATLGATDRGRIVARAVEAATPDEPFDLVFADPPYGLGSGNVALGLIITNGWAAENGWICVETERGDRVEVDGCSVEAERDVGRARLTLLRS